MATAQAENQAALLSETLGNVIDLITEESPLTQGFEEEIESVAPELRALQTLMEAAESNEEEDEDENLVSLLASVKEVSLLAKFQIEAFILRRDKRMKKGKLNKYISILDDVKARSEFLKSLKIIKVKIHDIFEQLKNSMAGSESSSPQEEEENCLLASSRGNNVVGRREDMARLRNYLMSGVSNQSVDSDVPSSSKSSGDASALSDNAQTLMHHIGNYFSIIPSSKGVGFRQQVRLSAVSIVGMEGVGKTTLASLMYKDHYVSRIFSSRVWVSVPRKFHPEEMLCSIAKQVITVGSDEPDERWSLGMLRESIHYSLAERPYLIVLDNVRTPEAWRLLRQVLPNTSQSRVLITTRDAEVATEASSSSGSIHHLKELTPQSSWQLFCTILGAKGGAPDKLQSLTQEIVEICRGTPLLILETAGILSWEAKTIERWSALLSELRQKGSLKHLISDALPSYLKKCLYFLLLFEQDFEISARRLTALWIAEGLVQPNPLKGDEPLEGIAKQYLLDLQNYFVVEVLKTKSNGDIKTCRLRNSVRTTLISKARAGNFFYDHSSNRILRLAHHPQRYSNNNEIEDGDEYWTLYGFCGIQPHSSSASYCFKYLRSFSSFDPREGPEPGECIKNFLHKCIKMGGCVRLRVLDLEGVFHPILTDVLLKELKELRYLSLRRTYAEFLPASVGSLRKLQTLDLKYTCISTMPFSIWKLKEVRHLYLGENYRTRFPSDTWEAISWNNLQTLSGGFIDDQTPVENGLDSLKNLRKLSLTCQMSMEKHKELGDWIVKLTSLENLRLRSVDEMVEPSLLYLERLSGLTKLNSLYLFGAIADPSRSILLSTLPDSLTEITLSLSKLELDPMPVVGRLVNLRSLSLLSDSYTGSNLSCPTSSFSVLRFLKLWKLTELEQFNVEEGAMPIIESIEIRFCRKLKFIPWRIENLTSFQ